MIAPIGQTAMTHMVSGNLFVLIMDAQGKPLALAPFQQLEHNPFPIDQIRLIDGQARMSEAKDETTLSQFSETHSDFLRQVETALKRLYDLAFLCEHPLARMQTVTARLEAQLAPGTCLDRARILQALLREAIEQLRPPGRLAAGADIPRREWHAYLILNRAYVEGEPNYRIMNWLQIGEGTFNRTRRASIRAAATVLMESERRAASG